MQDIQSLLNLPIQTLAVLTAGYLAYRIAYGGHAKGHATIDVVFLTLVFALIGKLGYSAASPSIFAPLVAIAPAVVCAAIWRMFLGDWVGDLLYRTGINCTDRHVSSWDSVRLHSAFKPKRVVLVLDDNSRVSSELGQFEDRAHGPCVFGDDGSVSMFVTGMQDAPGESWDDIDPSEMEGSTCMTYYPAQRIKEIRCYLLD
jgi:hypothetical protein